MIKEVISNAFGYFISSKVKGIRSSEKKFKTLEYLKNDIHIYTIYIYIYIYTHTHKHRLTHIYIHTYIGTQAKCT